MRMAENYKHLYEQAMKMLTKYQDELIPGYRRSIEELKIEYAWLKSCLNCKIRNECPRHCGKVVHDCDHWVYGDNVVLCMHCEWYDEDGEFCKFWNGVRHPEHSCGEGERKADGKGKPLETLE